MHIILVLFESPSFVDPTILDMALIFNVTFFITVKDVEYG